MSEALGCKMFIIGQGPEDEVSEPETELRVGRNNRYREVAA